MENKTISYLNSKTWYRLLKVLYILFFLFLLIVNNVIAFGYRKQLNYEKTIIDCHIGEKSSPAKNFNLNGVKGYVYFSSSDFNNYDYKKFFITPTNNNKIEAIIETCLSASSFTEITDDFNGKIQNIYDAQRLRDIGKENSTSTDEQKITKFNNEKSADPLNINIDYKYPLFDITPEYDTNLFIEYLLLGNASIILIFVIGQRIFYYIVLGKIKPKK